MDLNESQHGNIFEEILRIFKRKSWLGWWDAFPQVFSKDKRSRHFFLMIAAIDKKIPAI